MNNESGAPADREETISVIDEPGYGRTERVVRDAVAERRFQLQRASQLIWLVTGILEGMFGLRFLLKLIASNPENAFVRLLYGFTELFLRPFLTIQPTPEAGGMALEISTLIAMAVYALVAWVLVKVLWVIFDRPASRRVTTIEHD